MGSCINEENSKISVKKEESSIAAEVSDDKMEEEKIDLNGNIRGELNLKDKYKNLE